MRPLGLAGLECFDGPCDPWSKHCCRGCAIRPMKVYYGNPGTPSKDELQAGGYGALMSMIYYSKKYKTWKAERKVPRHAPYYALDNGAFSAYKNQVSWDGELFLQIADYYLKLDWRPDFLVLPDIVASKDSLDFSLHWRCNLPDVHGVRYYLAVQDGMDASVFHYQSHFDGIFVGGTLEWKYETAAKWVEKAHFYRMPCHIGRIGTADKITWALDLGADSIDSTSWSRHGAKHLRRAGGK